MPHRNLPILTNQALLGRPYALPDRNQNVWPRTPGRWGRLHDFLGCEPRAGAVYVVRFLQRPDGETQAVVTEVKTGREHVLARRPHGLVAVLSALELDNEQRVLATLRNHERHALAACRAANVQTVAGVLLASPDRERFGLWQYGPWELNPLRCARLSLIGDNVSASDEANWDDGERVAMHRTLFDRLPIDVAEEAAFNLDNEVRRSFARSYLGLSHAPSRFELVTALSVAEDDKQWASWVERVQSSTEFADPRVTEYGDPKLHDGRMVFLTRDHLADECRRDLAATTEARRARDESDPVTLATRADVEWHLFDGHAPRNWERSRVEAWMAGRFPMLERVATSIADGQGKAIAELIGVDLSV